MKLKLGTQSGLFYCVSTFAEKDIPKQAGFRWDGQGKCWVTKDAQIAAKLIEYAEPEIIPVLQEYNNKLMKAREASRAVDANIHIPVPEGLSYLPYQRAGIAYAADKQYSLIGDEMGLGKTIQALGLINLKEYRKVLIVCPASLKGNWAREAKKWLVGGQTIGIVNGEFPQTEVTIINYDILKKWHTELRLVQWDLIVCDEAHYLKNNKSQRTLEVVGGGKTRVEKIPAKQAIFLTGTPILNRPEELWTTLKFFGIFKTWEHYVTRYCAGVRDGWGWKTDGSSNLDELNNILREKCMVRRLKADVLTDLPAKQRRVVTIKADGKMKEVLKGQAEQANKFGFDLTVGDYDTDTLFDQLAAERKILGLAKVGFACDYIEELFEGGLESLVVFAHHREVLEKVQNFLNEKGIKTSRVDGGVKVEDRQGEVDKFQSGETQVFLGSIKAAGVGLTLTRASYEVFIEPSWTPADLKQAEDRCHRIGQKSAVQADYLVFENSLDEWILNLVLSKADVEAQALDLDGQPVGPVPTIEELIEKAKLEDVKNQGKLEAKKSTELKKHLFANFLKGDRVKAVVQIGMRLAEIRKCKGGWVVDGEYRASLPSFDRLWHTGCCAACGRKLTDSESILRGLGPVCAGVK